MWIIPKTLSAFVPDTEGLSLELDEQAWMLESSAMWRSKPSSKQTWLRRLKKGGWLTHLCGRILKPSLHQSFVERYAESLEDIPANPSVQQASEKAKTTRGTYGPISSSTSDLCRPVQVELQAKGTTRITKFSSPKNKKHHPFERMLLELLVSSIVIQSHIDRKQASR